MKHCKWDTKLIYLVLLLATASPLFAQVRQQSVQESFSHEEVARISALKSIQLLDQAIERLQEMKLMLVEKSKASIQGAKQVDSRIAQAKAKDAKYNKANEVSKPKNKQVKPSSTGKKAKGAVVPAEEPSKE